MNYTAKKLFFIFFLLFVVNQSFSQPPCGNPPCGGNGGGGGPGCFPKPCTVPIDQGTWALLIIGTLYGASKISNKKVKKDTNHSTLD